MECMCTFSINWLVFPKITSGYAGSPPKTSKGERLGIGEVGFFQAGCPSCCPANSIKEEVTLMNIYELTTMIAGH